MTWIPTSDLIGLPGVPTTHQSITRIARTAQWTRRRRKATGGGYEYHISALPPETRGAFLSRECPDQVAAGEIAAHRAAMAADIESRATAAKLEETLATAAGLAGERARRADARLAVIRYFETFIEARGISMRQGAAAFCKLYTDGAINAEDWVRDAVPGVTAKTLKRWRSTIRRAGVAGLAGKYGNRKGAGKIDGNPAVLSFLTAFLTEKPHASAQRAMRGLRARFDGAELPAYRTVQRWLEKYRRENEETLTAVANPDEWKSKYMVAFGDASEKVLRLNQLWELDSTIGDVMLSDGRHAVVGVVDVWSRRLKLLVSKTSTATAVAALMRRAMLDWGVPEEIKTDNGADYKSRHIGRVVAGLDITQTLCHAFSPWEKPHIERAFKTFSHDLVELLEGFVGHSVADRQAIEARHAFADRLFKKNQSVEIRMTAAAFQQFCDDWTEDLYAHSPHEGLGGVAPFNRAAEWRGEVRRIENERALDVLLAEAPGGDGLRTVGKKGVRVDGATYIAPELEAYVRQRVQVRYDETDIGKLFIFDEDSAFVCVAEAPEITGIDRQTVANEAKARQRHRISEERRRLKKAAKTERIADVAEEILAHARRNTVGVLTFPTPATSHESDGLDAAARASTARHDPRIVRDLTPEEQAEADATFNRLNGPPENVAPPVLPVIGAFGRPHFKSDEEYARWIMANPDAADSEDRAWFNGRTQDPSFRLLLGLDATSRIA